MENKRTYFFVDESGDLSRFDKKGRSLLGVEGVSKTFMLGSLEVLEPIEEIIKKMEELRADLIKDPCLLRTPSFFNYLRDKYSLIWDLDDKTKKDCGVYYTQKNPISLEKIKEL